MPGTKAPEAERREQILTAAYAAAAEHGLERLTIRQVATAAGLSSGSVLFHYETRVELIIALLEWLLETSAVLALPDSIAGMSPVEALAAAVRHEIRRFSDDPARIRLLFEYWIVGIRRAEVHARMRRDLHRYRDAFVPLAAAVIAADPVTFSEVSPQGLATVVVSFIKGCGIQTMIDLDHTDSHELRDTANHLLSELIRKSARAGS
ncbi:MAG TPA: TetR/AcrR family transcriptional regulator [Gemmatimonadales bacterium]|jgi:AcrR family transcriptional regulator